MIDIAWTTVVLSWTLIVITYSITKIKVHRCGGGIYSLEGYPLSKNQKWLLRLLVFLYIVLAFLFSLKFKINFFDNFMDISKFFFMKLGFTLFLIGEIIFLRSRIAISSNWGWDRQPKKNRGKLIKIGPYKTTRHPQYGAYLLAVLATGLMLLKSGILLFFVFLLPIMYLKIRIEEEILKEVFPNSYPKYIEETRMIL